MREYGDVWTDHEGRSWPVIKSARKLKFKYPLHAAVRKYVFHRDGFRCRRCDAFAVGVPQNYDGRRALLTNTKTGAGTHDVLIVDHVLTLAAGGTNHPDNMQALCETCNRRKQREDRAAIAAARVTA